MKRKTAGIFTLAALAAVLGGCLMLSSCGHEHTYGAWNVTTPATCTKEGSRERTCTQCGEKETEVLPATGHDWEVLDVITEATCTAPGEEYCQCLTCGEYGNVTVPATGHTLNVERTVEPTCETAGNDHYTCSACDYSEDKTVPALGHTWRFKETVSEPTCTQAGKNLEQCATCKNTRETDVAALGHNFEGMFTVDKRPSFEAPGEKSYHCTRCSERNQITVIPKLEENTPIEYEFRLLRNNGDLIVNKGAVITVKDQNGTVVKTSTAGETATGVYTASLLPKTYKVSVSNLPAGYTAEEYTVEAEDSYCRMWVTTSPIQGSIPADKRFVVGDVMYDFSIKTVNNETVSLSSLLQGKKGVLINFFYVGCTWCAKEFPGMEAAYKRYKDDIAVLAIDPYSAYHQTEDAIREYAANFKLSFHVALDTTLDLHKNFGISAYPASVFIDGEGAITRIDKTALVDANDESEQLFAQIFARLASDSYWQNPAKRGAAANTAVPAMLPLEDRKR